MSAMEYSGPERRRKLGEERVRILIVDDHVLFRVGIAQILSKESDLEVVGRGRGRPRARWTPPSTRRPTSSSWTSRCRRPAGSRPPSGSSASCRPCRSSSWPSRRTRTPSSTRSRPAPPRSSSRTSARTTSSTIIRRVSNGEYLINDKVFSQPAVASRVLKEFRELAVYGQEAAPIFAPLSPREVEILDNIAQGMTNKQVAYTLSISEQTVKNHMSSILRKLSVNDRTQAVVYAMRQGWIKMPED